MLASQIVLSAVNFIAAVADVTVPRGQSAQVFFRYYMCIHIRIYSLTWIGTWGIKNSFNYIRDELDAKTRKKKK